MHDYCLRPPFSLMSWYKGGTIDDGVPYGSHLQDLIFQIKHRHKETVPTELQGQES